jgi:hypothetical protein
VRRDDHAVFGAVATPPMGHRRRTSHPGAEGLARGRWDVRNGRLPERPLTGKGCATGRAAPATPTSGRHTAGPAAAAVPTGAILALCLDIAHVVTSL